MHRLLLAVLEAGQLNIQMPVGPGPGARPLVSSQVAFSYFAASYGFLTSSLIPQMLHPHDQSLSKARLPDPNSEERRIWVCEF